MSFWRGLNRAFNDVVGAAAPIVGAVGGMALGLPPSVGGAIGGAVTGIIDSGRSTGSQAATATNQQIAATAYQNAFAPIAQAPVAPVPPRTGQEPEKEKVSFMDTLKKYTWHIVGGTAAIGAIILTIVLTRPKKRKYGKR